jgi:arylformamidase
LSSNHLNAGFALAPSHPMKNQSEYYSQQYNARAAIPEHPGIFTRWQKDSAHVRRTNAGLFDMAYGESPGERLDLFPTKRSNAALLIFIHGGWWRSLDKSDFSFIVPGYTQAGFNVALTNYTLAPAASIREITLQQLHAVAWLYRNAENYDFDRERIVVAGHSAGGHLAAMMMAAQWNEFAIDLPTDLIKGGILMSGLYDLEPVRHANFVNNDLKLREDDVPLLSPARMPQSHAVRFVTAVGGLESDEFHRQNALIVNQWKANHVADIALPDKNHLTICDAFATRGNPLFDASVKLISSLA